MQGIMKAFVWRSNQIYYGSLQGACRGKGEKPKYEPKPTVWQLQSKLSSQTGIMKEFILGFKHLIEPSVFIDAMNNNEKALSLAVGQIHHKTLPEDTKSFKEAVLSPPPTQAPKFLQVKQNLPPRTSPIRGPCSIFFTGIDDVVNVATLWQLFKKAGAIKDIIMPRKRDKFGNRFGFVVAQNEREAEKIIGHLNGRNQGRNTLYLAKTKRKPGTKLSHSPTKSNPPQRQVNLNIPHVESKGVEIKNPSPNKNRVERGSPNQDTTIRPHPTTLSHDSGLQEELDKCVLLVTVKKETIGNVEMIVGGLGCKDAIIRGLLNNKFMAYFPEVESLEEVDLDFLGIGFLEVRKIQMDDLVVPHQACVDIRGLPILGWTEENYASLLRPWGEIIHYGRTLDEDAYYITPKLLIETAHLENINETKKIDLLGKQWSIRIVETYGVGSDLHADSDSDNDPEEGNVGPIFEEGHSDEAPILHDMNLEEAEDRVTENHDGTDGAVSEGDDGSCINPVTPRSFIPEEQDCHKEVTTLNTHHTIVNEPPVVEESPEFDLHTANWKPRERDSSTSFPKSTSDENKSNVEDNSDKEDSDSFTLTSGVLKELQNMKVQVKRGRPRNFKKNQFNKHFKLPRRKKSKGEGLQQISHQFLNANYDEAEAIYETCMMMGLLPSGSKDHSIELIKKNLK
ncbi:hypothetical protein DCAR_0311741 [Daucus carota subsp. sativus]|uniref:RRM domain-containing protein n=2 Tax=Daucus carota subsp. sativus TaxID=79200 RepID=A0A161WSA5_DAUCS|nr:hypothetical protein DCAR_0311741 [Daucus carota subsp. sativus]